MRTRPVPAVSVILLLILPSLSFLAGCAESTGPDPGSAPAVIDALPRELSESELAVIDASNAFSVDLLRTVEANDTSANVFLSGLSASMALGMTMNGAVGATWDSMRATLRFGELSEEQIDASYRDLIALLLGLDPRVEIGIANAIYVDQGFSVQQSFLDRVAEYFDAEASTLDFSDPSSLGVVNEWVAEKTHDRIKKILDGWPPGAVLALLNALYFKGDWTQQFDASATRPRPFTLPSGETVQVDAMRAEEALARIGEDTGTGAVIGELPYGGRAFVMDVVLPPAGVSLDDFVRNLNAEAWNRWMRALPDSFVSALVQMPKVELKYDRILNGDLIRLGMGIAFGVSASPPDFSRLGPGLSIALVKQKTYVRVDEEGTEAAAVTVVVTGVTSVGPATALIVNRPYLFAIRERLSGTVLFLGAVRDPGA